MQGAVELGIDRLAADDYSLLAGKRVGLIANQTDSNAGGTKTRVLLVKAGKSPRQVIAGWQPNEQELRRQPTPYLLY